MGESFHRCAGCVWNQGDEKHESGERKKRWDNTADSKTDMVVLPADAEQHQGDMERVRRWHLTLAQVCTSSARTCASAWDLIFLFREEDKKQERWHYVMRMCSSLDRHSVKKESGVSWSPAPPSSLNGRIPASRHALCHVFRRGQVLGQKGGRRGDGVAQGKRRKREMAGEGLLPVSKWRTLVSKSGQDGRNGTNRAPERGVWTWARGTQAKLIVFMLLDFWVDAGCVCWFVSTFFFSSSRVLLTGCLSPSSLSFGNLMKKNKQLSQICDAQARSSSRVSQIKKDVMLQV